MAAARSLLGDDCVLFTGGVLFNQPGAAVGNVHLDGDHLLGHPGRGLGLGLGLAILTLTTTPTLTLILTLTLALTLTPTPTLH